MSFAIDFLKAVLAFTKYETHPFQSMIAKVAEAVKASEDYPSVDNL